MEKVGADKPPVGMSETPTAEEAAAAARAKAAAVAGAGIQSYTHGSRTVSRSSPTELLDAADRIELREMRRKRGFVANCDCSGAAGG